MGGLQSVDVSGGDRMADRVANMMTACMVWQLRRRAGARNTAQAGSSAMLQERTQNVSSQDGRLPAKMATRRRRASGIGHGRATLVPMKLHENQVAEKRWPACKNQGKTLYKQRFLRSGAANRHEIIR
jgi:hypothetical protein